jgi:hypothetical protein
MKKMDVQKYTSPTTQGLFQEVSMMKSSGYTQRILAFILIVILMFIGERYRKAECIRLVL